MQISLNDTVLNKTRRGQRALLQPVCAHFSTASLIELSSHSASHLGQNESHRAYEAVYRSHWPIGCCELCVVPLHGASTKQRCGSAVGISFASQKRATPSATHLLKFAIRHSDAAQRRLLEAQRTRLAIINTSACRCVVIKNKNNHPTIGTANRNWCAPLALHARPSLHCRWPLV
jgi:hypothetical protein